MTTLLDPGFETPSLAAGTFVYNPTGSPWAYAGNAGLASNGSAFTSGNPPAPQGSQVVFIQDVGTISQAAVFDAGVYTLSLSAAVRGNTGQKPGAQGLAVFVDGVRVGTIVPLGAAYAQYATGQFTVTAGSHSISITGINPSGHDNTLFVDQATLTKLVITSFNGRVGDVTLEAGDVLGAIGHPLALTDEGNIFTGNQQIDIDNPSVSGLLINCGDEQSMQAPPLAVRHDDGYIFHAWTGGKGITNSPWYLHSSWDNGGFSGALAFQPAFQGRGPMDLAGGFSILPLRESNTVFLSLFNTDWVYKPDTIYHKFTFGTGSDPLNHSAPPGLDRFSWTFYSATQTEGDGLPFRFLIGSHECLKIETDQVSVKCQLAITIPGKGLSIKTGSNCKMGSGTLIGGLATISNTSITPVSKIFLTATASNLFNLGSLTVSSQTTGAGFTVKSTNTADNSTFNYLIIEPA